MRQEAPTTVSLIGGRLLVEARLFCPMGRCRPRLQTGLAEVVSNERYAPGSSPNSRNLCLTSPEVLVSVGPLRSPGGGVPGGAGEFTRSSTAQQLPYQPPQTHPPTIPPLGPSPASPQRCPHRPVECPASPPAHRSCSALPRQAWPQGRSRSDPGRQKAGGARWAADSASIRRNCTATSTIAKGACGEARVQGLSSRV